jgi:hypothetical protein
VAEGEALADAEALAEGDALADAEGLAIMLPLMADPLPVALGVALADA